MMYRLFILIFALCSFAQTQIFRSIDWGTWVNTFNAPANEFVDSFKVSASGDTVILTAYSETSFGEIFKSLLWGTFVQSFTPTYHINGFTAEQSGDTIWLTANSLDGSSQRIIMSTIWGTAVQSASCDLGEAVRSITGTQNGDTIFLGISCGTVIGVKEGIVGTDFPKDWQKSGIGNDLVFAFGNIIPNPCVNKVTFFYSIAKEADVNLTIYDYCGREVKTLVDEKKSAGRYRLDYRLEKFSAGAYFIKFTAGNFVSMKKLIVFGH